MFPGSKCKEQALDVKRMLCPPNCSVILHGSYMKSQPVSSIITLNYLFIFLYITNNNTEKLMFLPYKSGSITAVKLVVKSVRLKFK